VSATKIAAAGGAVLFLPVLVVIATLAALLSVFPGTGGPFNRAALTDIPADYLDHYVRAAALCPGLDWSVLAAIGKIETDHGRSTLPGVRSGENASGAGGVMQVLAPTWQEILTRHDIPPGGATPPSRYNPHDAISAAAFYLCDNGAPADLPAAIFAYNHADWYVDQVLDQAAAYHLAAASGGATTGTQDSGWPDEQATLPDPTGTSGRLTPRMHTLHQALATAGAIRGGATCWDPHLHNPTSDHPRGKACDIFFNPDNPADVANGWDVANWLTTVQATYGIRYIIWQGRIWTARSPAWKTYTSDIYNCPDPANITGCHYDHIHTSVY
jgi:hypothetical protein